MAPRPAALVSLGRPETHGSRLAVQQLAVDDLTPAQLAAWESLHRSQTGVSNPFTSPTWVTAWYRHYVPRSNRVLLWITDGDRLVGVAPLYRQERSLGPLAIARRLELVGAGRSTPLEIPPLLCAKGEGRAVTRAFVEAGLPRDVTWAELCLSHEHGWLATQDLATRDGLAVFSRYQQVRACVVLPLAATWEETRSALKRNVKESVRRARNRLAKDGRPWRINRRSGDHLDGDVVERFLRLHRARARYHESASTHHDAFADPTTATFLRDTLPRLGASGEASVLELELDGQVVAAQLVLHPPGGIYFHSSGFLPGVWSLSPVTTLQVDAMGAAIERGETWVNFSPGPNESKLRWSDELAVWNDVVVGPSRRSCLARYAVFSAARDARQLTHERRRDLRALAARAHSDAR